MTVRKVRLFDSDNNSIYENYILQLPIKEEYILAESEKVFNDSEPCVIHRNYVIKKLYLELADWLECVKARDGIIISDEEKVSYFLNFIDIKISAERIEII